MKKWSKIECLIWGVALLPIVITALVYARLPAEIPTHWGISGAIDVYSPKSAAWAMPAVALCLAALMKWIPSIDPRRENYRKFGGAYNAFRLVFSLFFLLLHAAMLFAAFEPTRLPMERVITVCVGGLFCVMGNYMPNFRHNYFCGIRTPWTLASEEVWARTHRMGGAMWFVAGVIVMLCGFFIALPPLLFVVVLSIVAVCALVSFVYSYILYKRTKTPPSD